MNLWKNFPQPFLFLILMNFYEKIWNLMKKIPKGKVSTYKELARAAGSPKAARAVGNACNKNPNAPKVPCHRVVSSDGSLGGYAHGLAAKTKILRSEGIKIKGNQIEDFEKVLYKF